MSLLDHTYFEIRSRICDTFLVCFAILTIPTLAASLYRAQDIGWQPIMISHILIATIIWSVALFRRYLAYYVRAVTLVGVFVVVGLSGVATFGLMAGGVAWLVITPVLATLLLGMRAGLALLVGVIVTTSVIGIGFVLERQLPSFDPAVYLTSASSWALAETSWIIVGGCMVMAVGVLNKFLVESLEASVRNARALEESECNYRNILENMVDTFYRTDLEGRISMVSPSVVDIGGYSADELIGENLAQYCVDDGSGAEFTRLLKEGGGKITDYEVETWTKDGRTAWSSISARYWRATDGSILGIEGTVRNITSHKLAEKVLRHSQKMDAIGQLTGGIAHDYNNMLGVIMGNLQLVQSAADLDEKSICRLDKAMAAARRNAALTNKLIGFSQTQEHRTQLTSVNAFIVNLEDIITTSGTAVIEARSNLADDLWMVDIDVAELEDAVLNLSVNARDAMLEGGTLSYETANKTLDADFARYNPDCHAGDYIMISVSDTGAGMSEEICEKIFEPYFSTKETGKGRGLGLSMVYDFVMRSGGFIKVRSVPGEGTTFSIFLPRAHSRADGSTQDGEKMEHDPSRGNETILVVDDERSLADIAVTYLEGLGYRVFTANSGQQALDVLKTHTGIDILFSDIVMPGDLDGYQLASAASKTYPSLKVLLTSGFTNRRAEVIASDDETIARMATNLLSKPYNLPELASSLRAVLDERV